MIVRADALAAPPAWLDAFPSLKAVYEDWLARKLVSPEEFAALADEMKTQAFSAVVTMNDIQRQKLLDALGRAISEGLTVKDVRDLAGGLLNNPAYADLVYRQNLTNAFQTGKYREMFGPLGQAYPYWRHLAVLDSRNDEPSECPNLICRALDGKVFPKSAAWARHLLPPNHFQDRCITEEISETEAASLKIETSFHLHPAEGFDYDKGRGGF